MTAARRLRPGDAMPAFRLPAGDGTIVDSASLLGAGPLVVYFYPKDETPGCRVEACAFRDEYEAFLAAGARVIGLSRDSVDSHRDFAARHHLPFPLLADPDGQVHAAFGVGKVLGFIPGRETFVVDRDGIVRHHFDSMVRPRRHVHQALDAVRRLVPRPPAG